MPHSELSFKITNYFFQDVLIFNMQFLLYRTKIYDFITYFLTFKLTINKLAFINKQHYQYVKINIVHF